MARYYCVAPVIPCPGVRLAFSNRDLVLDLTCLRALLQPCSAVDSLACIVLIRLLPADRETASVSRVLEHRGSAASSLSSSLAKGARQGQQERHRRRWICRQVRVAHRGVHPPQGPPVKEAEDHRPVHQEPAVHGRRARLPPDRLPAWCAPCTRLLQICIAVQLCIVTCNEQRAASTSCLQYTLQVMHAFDNASIDICGTLILTGQSQPPNHLSMFLEVADSRASAADWSCFVSHRLAVVNQKSEDRTVGKESQNRYSKVRSDTPQCTSCNEQWFATCTRVAQMC